MSVDLPNSCHCSCCQPLFHVHIQLRNIYPAHSSYGTIHSYSSTWLGLAEWRQNTRAEPSQHQLLDNLNATREEPASSKPSRSFRYALFLIRSLSLIHFCLRSKFSPVTHRTSSRSSSLFSTQTFSTLKLSENLSTHSTRPESILCVPISELRIGSNNNAKAKRHLQLDLHFPRVCTYL
ncbi:hypothetical protein BLNAU_11452 [Blattamonas nauphoetae]|uniref:Uncharacterized protein n=1 Tax=Blattamonas nauphoetae TaxID=2049346 RepID=A0ABQ9XPP8_9EUKA|nr:hypothetical protein BLNAU_19739 [Blattamonas nauphoetae]KAK2946283.1 hypothetical protein BLNAU_18804 [Blattamonas nauphoetae]KAK2953357.1 hypothetical protein BLNAU_11642 [Blattamonas nauphoetae]KAK2953588.1 hypothetical protein BLNAU_11452 [Blattamonas nauphoetae]